MLSTPKFLPVDLATAPLEFPWSSQISIELDDLRDIYRGESEHLGGLKSRLADLDLRPISYRGGMSAGLATLEWVVVRLDGHVDVRDARDRLEAAWASVIDVRYARSLDYDTGLIREFPFSTLADPAGPLQSVYSHLGMMQHRYAKGRGILLDVASCCALAMHVVPASAGFDQWLRATVKDLAEAHPRTQPFDSNVKRHDYSGERPVPRPWFDDRSSSSRSFLSALRPGDNPYLKSAAEMHAEGYEGRPYGGGD